MIQAWVRENLEAGAHRATLGVIAPVGEARHARLNDRAGAHAARFDSHVKSCAGEPVISEDTRAFAEHDDFSVGSGVTVAYGAIARAGDNFSVMHQNGADWDFARDGGGARFVQSLLHEVDIIHFAGE